LMPASLRIVIAEDAAIMRDGLTQTLTRRGHQVVAAVGDADALRAAVGTPPQIHRDHPRIGVLVFSQYIEAASAAELFAGAPAGVGYLLKDRVADVSDFTEASPTL